MQQERKKTEEKKNNPNRMRSLYRLNLIVLSLVTIFCAAAAVLLLLRIRAVTGTEHGAFYYSDKQIEAIRAQSRQEGRESAVSEINESITGGNSLSGAIQDVLAGQQVVIAAGGSALIEPVNTNLALSSLDPALFYQKSGLMAYKNAGSSRLVTSCFARVSEQQGEISWTKAAATRLSGAMVCIGQGNEGAMNYDGFFAANVMGARGNGMDVGCWFTLGTTSEQEAIGEARAAIGALDDIRSLLTGEVAIQVKSPTSTAVDPDQRLALTRAVSAACLTLRENGYTPVICGDLGALLLRLDPTQLEDYDKWVIDTDGEISDPYKYRMWEYTDHGSISGIGGDVGVSVRILPRQQ